MKSITSKNGTGEQTLLNCYQVPKLYKQKVIILLSMIQPWMITDKEEAPKCVEPKGPGRIKDKTILFRCITRV